jgi:membrane protease YdiL (CAAX protease family)
VIELVGALGGATAAVYCYAALILVFANHLGVRLLHTRAEAARESAAFAVLAIPLLLRLTALTVETGPVVAVRHYSLIGLAAGTATVCALLALPELRPALARPGVVLQQVAIAIAGLAAGLALALVFDRGSVAPQSDPWRNAAPLLALLVLAGAVEEVLFRGMLQTVLRRLYGRAAPLAGTAAFGLVYANVHPASFVLAALVLGLCSAAIVERTRSIHGVVAGRVLLLVGLVYLWPRLFHLS